jgi:hypothetical protein
MPTTRDILNTKMAGVSTYTTSADMTSAADITVAPPAGQSIFIDTVMIASDTQITFSFLEETSGTVISAMILFPNYTFLINPDSDWSVPTPGKKLQGKSSGSGNVYITVWYHYE